MRLDALLNNLISVDAVCKHKLLQMYALLELLYLWLLKEAQRKTELWEMRVQKENRITKIVWQGRTLVLKTNYEEGYGEGVAEISPMFPMCSMFLSLGQISYGLTAQKIWRKKKRQNKKPPRTDERKEWHNKVNLLKSHLNINKFNDLIITRYPSPSGTG